MAAGGACCRAIAAGVLLNMDVVGEEVSMANLQQDAAAALAPADTLLGIVRGYHHAQALWVAATLGIADHLANGPRSVSDLAAATGTHAPSLLRLLRALASIDVFAENDGQRFCLTPLAEPLRADAPSSARNLLRLLGDPILFASWGQLLHSVRTGGPAFNQVYGMGLYPYLAQHPEAAEVFNAGMASLPRHQAALEIYEFGDAGTIVDVGGGNGRLITAILRAHPEQRGILYDLPEVVASARERLEREGLGERCQVVGGGFMESVPAGGDLYLLSDVLHNWDDSQALTILANCRKVMAAAGRLVVIQEVLPANNDDAIGRFSDLNMLILLGGRERTADDFRELLSTAGFAMSRIIPTRVSYSVIEAVPAEFSQT
jgi:SAM-dependent methyltransferase